MKMSIDITLTLVQLMSNGLKVRVNIKSIAPLFWERYKLKVLLLPPCSVNSVDRMPLLQSGSRWFESITEHHIIPDRLIGKSSVFGTEDSTFDPWSGNLYNTN